ncbi:MAG TPA: 30S ribosomal protein S5 [Candidatus Paceibacterota bacterium]|nr:30S ribosomal protein S5 [Candidatus Paceibacterota bacterium]
MAELTDEKNIDTTTDTAPEAAAETAAPAAAPAADARAPRGGDRRNPRGRQGGRPGGNRGPRPERKTEFDQRMISIRRVARVIAGGRRFSFSVSIIIGNKKGRVGVGVGKAGDTTLAIDKAVRDAKKHMITVPLTKDNSIAHEINAKFNASRVSLMPAHGRGLVAGSSVRPVLELAGISNIVAKVHSGSKNGLNNARAAIEALKTLKA